MKVISGTARGKNLETLDGLATRPTIARVKEGIFSSVQFLIPGAAVLDLFAGSGQMGIECLSRGAKSCVFVDQSKEAIGVVTRNVKNCSLSQNAKIVNSRSQDYTNRTTEKFDIVILDPPYNCGILDEIMPRIYEITNDGGIIIAESEDTWSLKNTIEGLYEVKTYKYGKVKVTKFQKGETE